MMTMFLYRDILKKSLAITWTHKNLWFFGVFAALLGGVGQYAMSMSRSPEDWTTSVFSALAIFGQNVNGNIFAKLGHLFSVDPTTAIIFTSFLLIVIILSLFILWLAVVSQAGLVNNGAAIIKNGNSKTGVAIRDGLEKGIKKFWQVLGFNMIGTAVTYFLAALVGLPLVFLTATSDIRVFWLYTALFIVFIPLALIISFLIKYAINFSVVKDKKFVDSIVDAFRLFSKYWLISIEMALILFMIDFLFVFVIVLIVLVLAIPFIFIARILAVSLFVMIGMDNFLQFFMTAGLFLILFFVVWGGALITVFKTVAWTDIFVSLIEKKGNLAKLERMAAKLKK